MGLLTLNVMLELDPTHTFININQRMLNGGACHVSLYPLYSIYSLYLYYSLYSFDAL